MSDVMSSSGLAAWAPTWAHRFGTAARSGTASVFVLYGNTSDLFALDEARDEYGPLSHFLAEQAFGRYDLVLHYDLGRGLRVFAGGDAARLAAMREKAATMPTLDGLLQKAERADAAVMMQGLDAIFRNNLMTPADRRLKMAFLVDHASFLFPSGEPGRQSFPAAGMLVTALNWATSPHLKAVDMSIVLIDERKADVNERLAGSPHVVAIELPMPDEKERTAFIASSVCKGIEPAADYTIPQLGTLTAGLSLTSVRGLVLPAIRGGDRLSAKVFSELKKRLIEQQCLGLLEFVEPKWGLESVIGFDAAKAQLMEDAKLLARGELDTLPMGYLICGPVGTGKSFLAYCTAKEIGIPVVTLKNFRSKYVGETEGNLERVFAVLRAMGPIMIIVDEADTLLGNRDSDGDSGTGSRVFGMFATQMGDTRYRGRLVWMLLTARPDLLPIDIKRQGRAEVHIPLFYTYESEELRQMFVVLAKKIGATLAAGDVPTIEATGSLSGSDVEGIVVRAWRASRLSGAIHLTKESLAEVLRDFVPSAQTLERELQELAAVIECTDRRFLPPAIREKYDTPNGRRDAQTRFAEVRALLGD
ncbi:MAG: AAA family ATPase [Gemmatimonadaceae bacterium]